VTDAITGQQDYCITFIDVQDNNGDNICDPSDLQRVIVEGEVYTEALEAIENVEVELANNAPSEMTNENGEYAFGDMPMGGSYDIRPEKNDDYLNGVSTFDLVIIQRHILGSESLDSPYKRIAADANNSHNITALDLIELRKLILGIYDELPTNDSWRFVSVDHTFADRDNPWVSDWPESYEIYELNTDMEIDFVGVKIGDVNGSAAVNLNGTNIESRNRNELKFNVEALQLKKGERATVALTAENYNDIVGWQTTLSYDPAQLKLVDFGKGGLNINSDIHTNLSQSESGSVAISYVPELAETLTDGQLLFTVEVEAIVDVNGDAVYLDSSVLQSEAYDESGMFLDLKMGDNVEQEFVEDILGVSPNPLINEAKLKFTIVESGQVKFDFYDANGRLLHNIVNNYNAGENTIRLKKSEINTSGVVYVKMTTDKTILEYKIIVL